MKKQVTLLAILAGCQIMAGGRTTTPAANNPASGDPTASGDPSGPTGSTGPTAAAPAGPVAGPGADGKLVVPNLIGKTLEEAQAMARQAGFKAEIETTHPVECDNEKVPGKIKCQDPEPGQHVSTYAMISVQVYKEQEFAGSLVRKQLDPIRGMKIVDAKAYLAKHGFTGTIRLEQGMQFIKGCDFDTVCDVQPESGVSLSGEIEFTINKKLEISAPPPD